MDTENQTNIAEITTDSEPEKRKSREQLLEEAEARAKKRRLIPPFVMLLAGAVLGIIMVIMRYKPQKMLTILLCILIGFYIAGELIRWMLDRFEAQITEALIEEGEVIEKEPDESVLDGSFGDVQTEQVGEYGE